MWGTAMARYTSHKPGHTNSDTPGAVCFYPQPLSLWSWRKCYVHKAVGKREVDNKCYLTCDGKVFVPLLKGSPFPDVKSTGCSSMFQNQQKNGSHFSLLWGWDDFCIKWNQMKLIFWRSVVLNVDSSVDFKLIILFQGSFSIREGKIWPELHIQQEEFR